LKFSRKEILLKDQRPPASWGKEEGLSKGLRSHALMGIADEDRTFDDAVCFQIIF